MEFRKPKTRTENQKKNDQRLSQYFKDYHAKIKILKEDKDNFLVSKIKELENETGEKLYTPPEEIEKKKRGRPPKVNNNNVVHIENIESSENIL